MTAVLPSTRESNLTIHSTELANLLLMVKEEYRPILSGVIQQFNAKITEGDVRAAEAIQLTFAQMIQLFVKAHSDAIPQR